MDNKSLSKGAKAALAGISTDAFSLAKKVDSYTTKSWDDIIVRTKKQMEETSAKYAAAAAQTAKLFQLLMSSPTVKTWTLAFPRFKTLFSEMQTATGSFSRIESPKKAAWIAASKAIQNIERRIPEVVKVVKGADAEAIKKSLDDFAEAGLRDCADLKKAA